MNELEYELEYQSIEDIESSISFFDNLVAGLTPMQKASNYAKSLNISLSDGQLNKVLGMYATSLLSIEECVDTLVF